MLPVFWMWTTQWNIGQWHWTTAFTSRLPQGQASCQDWCKAWNIKEMQCNTLLLCNATPGLYTFRCDEHKGEKNSIRTAKQAIWQKQKLSPRAGHNAITLTQIQWQLGIFRILKCRFWCATQPCLENNNVWFEEASRHIAWGYNK